MDRRAIVKEYQTQVMKSFEFCKRMFANGFNSEEQFNTAKRICQNHINLCIRLCKTVKPRFGWVQITAQKNFKTLWDTCEYTVEQIKNMTNKELRGYEINMKTLDDLEQKRLYPLEIFDNEKLKIKFDVIIVLW